MASQYDLSGVAKFFERGSGTVRALDGVDLEIERGEFLALEGPSGSGKTTLLQLLGALDRPSEGTVLFEGRDLAKLPDNQLAALRLRSFGFVFQQFNLIPTLTAVENVEVKLAPVGPAVLVYGFALAVLGGLIAGTAAAARAARLRPADALRQVD